MKVLNRETKNIKRKFLEADPDNPRVHNPQQREALAAAFDEIGFVGHVLVRPHPEKRNRYIVVDGHERIDHFKDNQAVPCCVLDVDAAQAKKLLLSYDPLGYLKEIDSEAESALREMVSFESEDLDRMVAEALRDLEPEENHEVEPQGEEELEGVGEPRDTSKPHQLTFVVDDPSQKTIYQAIELVKVTTEFDPPHVDAKALTEICRRYIDQSEGTAGQTDSKK